MAKVLISMPDELLARLDERAKLRGKTRSEFIRDALEPALRRPTPEEVEQFLERSRRRSEKYSKGKPHIPAEDFIRWDRDHGHSV